jgi:hypothetical protein
MVSVAVTVAVVAPSAAIDPGVMESDSAAAAKVTAVCFWWPLWVAVTVAVPWLQLSHDVSGAVH